MKTIVLLVALAVGACSVLETLTKRSPAFDPRIPIEPGSSIPDSIAGPLGKTERDKYRCIGDRVMWCESFGNVMACRCTL